MNIWEEAERRYPALQPDDEELTHKRFELRSFRRSAFHSGAEWARGEAFRDALSIAQNAICYNGSDWGHGWDEAVNYVVVELAKARERLATDDS